MLQIYIFFFALSSRVKSGLLAVLFLRRRNSKSHTSFPLSFCNTVPRSHHSFYQTISPPTSLYSFAQPTTVIISALLCLDKYSLFVKTLYRAARFSMVSSLSLTYSTASVLNLSSCCLPKSSLHHLF